MSKLSKTFVHSTGEALADENLQGLVGENFPKFNAVVKAAIGIDDISTLTKIILTLIPGIDMPGYAAIKHALDSPMTKIIVMRNSAEAAQDEQ